MSKDVSLLRLVVRGWESDASRPQGGVEEALLGEDAAAAEEALRVALEDFRERWPGITSGDEVLLMSLAKHLEPGEAWLQALVTLRLGDLFLAAACVAQDRSALAILEEEFLQQLSLRLRELPNEEDLTQEIRHRVWEKLIAPASGGEGKIGQYAGVGTLKSWLQTVVTREALGVIRAQKREKPLGDDVFWRMACPADDQEEQYLKHLYRDAFKQAFQASLAALVSRDRTILKCHYVDGLSCEQIGVIYRAHRATVARWLQRIRETLLQETATLMHQELGLSQDGAQSLFHLIQSQLDLSIARILEK